MWSLLAVLLTLLSSALLFFSWKHIISPHKTKYISTAWVGLLLALFCWSQALGIEYAPIYGWLMLSFSILIIIAYHREQRANTNQPTPKKPLSFPSIAVSLKQLALVFLIIPMSGWASMVTTVVLARYLPWPAENIIVFSMLVIPIIWALLVYMICFKQRLWGDFMHLSLVSLLATLIIYRFSE